MHGESLHFGLSGHSKIAIGVISAAAMRVRFWKRQNSAHDPNQPGKVLRSRRSM